MTGPRITAAKADRLWRALDAVLECVDVSDLPVHAQRALSHLSTSMSPIQGKGLENDRKRGR